MNIEELIKEASDADKAPEALLKIKEEFDGLKAQLDSANNYKETAEKKIADLRDSNTKLFLRITGEAEEEEQEEKPLTFEELMKEGEE